MKRRIFKENDLTGGKILDNIKQIVPRGTSVVEVFLRC